MFAFGEREQRIRIGRIDVGCVRDGTNAGIARSADDGRDRTVAREAPGEGVFAAAAAGNQDPHETNKTRVFKALTDSTDLLALPLGSMSTL